MSHGPSRHGSSCTCVLCTGFTPENARDMGARGGQVIAHGARSERHLAPIVRGVRDELLVRMGMRDGELSWVGRELLDTFARAQAKVVTIDEWLEREPLIRSDGSVPPVMSTYFTALRVSTRALAELREVVADMRREDHDIASALAALDVEELQR